MCEKTLGGAGERRKGEIIPAVEGLHTVNSPVTKLKPTCVTWTGLEGPEISGTLFGDPSMLFMNFEKPIFVFALASAVGLTSSELRLGLNVPDPVV